MSIVIRIGAARDEVRVTSAKGTAVFDRAAMRKNGDHKLVDRLRHEVRDVWSDLNGFHEGRKARGNKRRNALQRDKQKREVHA